MSTKKEDLIVVGNIGIASHYGDAYLEIEIYEGSSKCVDSMKLDFKKRSLKKVLGEFRDWFDSMEERFRVE